MSILNTPTLSTQSASQTRYTTRQGQSGVLYKVFVAGVPASAKTSTIVTYFSQFGNFMMDQDSSRRPDSSHGLESRGHCLLTTRDSHAYAEVTQRKYFAYLGRTLTVLPHKTGVGLIVHNKKLNRCRVILKRVPRWLGEDSLRSLLETKVGPVQALFQFKSADTCDSYKGGSRYDTYSAIFEDKLHARQLTTTGQVDLGNGTVVVVEKYKKHSNRKIVEQANINNELHQVKTDQGKGCATTCNTWSEFSQIKQREDRLQSLNSISPHIIEEIDHCILPTSVRYSSRGTKLNSSPSTHDSVNDSGELTFRQSNTYKIWAY